MLVTSFIWITIMCWWFVAVGVSLLKRYRKFVDGCMTLNKFKQKYNWNNIGLKFKLIFYKPILDGLPFNIVFRCNSWRWSNHFLFNFGLPIIRCRTLSCGIISFLFTTRWISLSFSTLFSPSLLLEFEENLKALE